MNFQDYLAKHPKKYLIFDFDHTIYSLILPWEVYLKEMPQRMLEVAPQLAGREAEFKSVNKMENEAVRLVADAAVKARHAYSAEFESEYYQGVEPHQDIINFITDNRDNYTFFLWTSNMRSTVEPILKEKGMFDIFETLVTKSDVRLTKPYPEGFSLIFNPDKHDKKDFLLIGDSHNDEGAAKAVGIDFYCVLDSANQY